MVGRELLSGSHFVDTIANTAGKAGVRVIVVGAVGSNRSRVDIDLALLRNDGQVSSRNRRCECAANVFVAGRARLKIERGLGPLGPGPRNDQRNVEREIARFLVLGIIWTIGRPLLDGIMRALR